MKFKTTVRLITFLFIIVVMSFHFVYSLESNNNNYYADLDIYVSKTGDVLFKGNTNYDDYKGLSSKYTSKDGEYWVLNITSKEYFSNYIYTLHLPVGSEVNYIKTSELSRIVSGENVEIIGLGNNDKFTIVIQYKINNNVFQNNKLIYGLIISILIMMVLFVLFYRYNKNKIKKYEESEPETKSDSNKDNMNNSDNIDYEVLTERQITIVKLVVENQGSIHQFELEKMCNMPKSSLSRNITSLVNKGVLSKDQKGMSNLIRLNFKYSNKK